MKGKGNKVSILKIEKIPIFFPWFAKIWIWGWEKMGKKYMEREGKSICLNTLLVYCYHYFLYIKQDLSCNILYNLSMTLTSHFFTRNLNDYTAHKNDWPCTCLQLVLCGLIFLSNILYW